MVQPKKEKQLKKKSKTLEIDDADCCPFFRMRGGEGFCNFLWVVGDDQTFAHCDYYSGEIKRPEEGGYGYLYQNEDFDEDGNCSYRFPDHCPLWKGPITVVLGEKAVKAHVRAGYIFHQMLEPRTKADRRLLEPIVIQENKEKHDHAVLSMEL